MMIRLLLITLWWMVNVFHHPNSTTVMAIRNNKVKMENNRFDNVVVSSDDADDPKVTTHIKYKNSRHLQSILVLDSPDSPRYGGIGIQCDNSFGTNPCGSDGICFDKVGGGYFCQPFSDGIFDDCSTSGGCSPNSYCSLVSTKRKMCLCNTGYQRYDPYLPCTLISKTMKKANILSATTTKAATTNIFSNRTV